MNKNLKSLKNGQTNKDLYEVANYYSIEVDDISFVDDIDFNDNEYCIVNLGNLVNKGTHWVCFVLYKNILSYFDAFGFRPPMQIVNYCKSNNIKCYYNVDQIQKLDEKICGLYCLLFLMIAQNYGAINSKKDFNNILEELKHWHIKT